jgi:hypothetical protein
MNLAKLLVALALAVVALGSTAVPQAANDYPPGPGVAANDYPPGPGVAANDTPPGPGVAAIGPEI